jgi:hypothetical protein
MLVNIQLHVWCGKVGNVSTKMSMIWPGRELQQKTGEKLLETESIYVNFPTGMFPEMQWTYGQRTYNYVYSNYTQRWDILTVFYISWPPA